MRRVAFVTVVLVMLAGVTTGLWAGQGPGPCRCDVRIDVDPEDGFCDACGGCIPVNDGPYGPGA